MCGSVCVQQRAMDPLCFGKLCFGCLSVDRKVPFGEVEERGTVRVEPHTECHVMNGLFNNLSAATVICLYPLASFLILFYFFVFQVSGQ